MELFGGRRGHSLQSLLKSLLWIKRTNVLLGGRRGRSLQSPSESPLNLRTNVLASPLQTLLQSLLWKDNCTVRGHKGQPLLQSLFLKLQDTCSGWRTQGFTSNAFPSQSFSKITGRMIWLKDSEATSKAFPSQSFSKITGHMFWLKDTEAYL